jgi:hypothetical protein
MPQDIALRNAAIDAVMATLEDSSGASNRLSFSSRQ